MDARYIDRHLWASWDSPPPFADFSLRFDELLASIRTELRARTLGASHWLRLFVRVPLVVTGALDYQLSTDGGRGAQVLLWAIRLLRCVFLGNAGAARCVLERQPAIPQSLLAHRIVSRGDRYSWQASCPALVRQLAVRVLSEFHPDLVVAGSHGSIRSGALLSLYLGSRLYFLRLSRFKRSDPHPMVSAADHAYLNREAGRTRHVLIFEEDSMSGRSLELLATEAARRFPAVRTASILRSAQCNPRPDFCVKLVG